MNLNDAASILRCVSGGDSNIANDENNEHVSPLSKDVVTSTLTVNVEGKSALELFAEKRAKRGIYTLNQGLDRMLGEGVSRGEITEFCKLCPDIVLL